MSLMRLLFKSKEELEREKRELTQSSFPYGPQQQEAIEALLAELLPEEPESLRRTIFLIGKKACQADGGLTPEAGLPLRQALPQTFRVLDKQLFGRHGKKLPRYLALILADAAVTEALEYPEAEELLARAEQLEPQCRKEKNSRRPLGSSRGSL